MTIQSENTAMVVMLTDNAAAKIKGVIESEGLDGYGLRIVAMQGCGGIQYGLDFEDTANEGDEVVEVKGIKVYVDATSATLLRGATIDYVSDARGEGFRFLNPNAPVHQGCGGCSCDSDDDDCGGCH